MSPPRPETAEILRQHTTTFHQRHGNSISAEQARALRDLVRCRTAALGGHRQRCDRCEHEIVLYNSCRNRHCPKCQAMARARWLEARRAELLEVPYCHVVFTLHRGLAPLARANPRQLYELLFRAAAETLLTVARDRLGGELGLLAILHTWGQTLQHHPHLHCLVPAGGLAADRSCWIPCRKGFFLPVRVLSCVFRGKLLARLDEAYRQRKLVLTGALEPLAEARRWQGWLRELRRSDWVVYAKPPLGGADVVLKYLARYIHRVAISNDRLLGHEDGRVRLRWKDYRRGGRQRILELDAVEFIRRFLQHVLPRGFVRIRYFGFLAARVRTRKLALIRRLLPPAEAPDVPAPPPVVSPAQPVDRCPRCGEGRLVIVARVEPRPVPTAFHDTS